MKPEEITKARKAAGLTGEQAARVCYVNTRTWWRWERGEYSMPQSAWELFTLRAQEPINTRL